MNAKEFASYFDHTLLKSEGSATQIQKLCQEARENGFATVCINPYWLPLAAKELSGSSTVPITVVGFPLGASTTSTKVFETKNAIELGAKEIDMVINIGLVKSGNYQMCGKDIEAVYVACNGIPLKVILETSLLENDEITRISKICSEIGVAFVKTSTGFGSRGASVEDIKLMKAAISDKVKIKASGGIRTLEDAEKMIAAGAHRVGASASVGILKEWIEKHGDEK